MTMLDILAYICVKLIFVNGSKFTTSRPRLPELGSMTQLLLLGKIRGGKRREGRPAMNAINVNKMHIKGKS